MPRVIYQPITRASQLDPVIIFKDLLKSRLPNLPDEVVSELTWAMMSNEIFFEDFVNCPTCLTSSYGGVRRKIASCDRLPPWSTTAYGTAIAMIKPINISIPPNIVFIPSRLSASLISGIPFGYIMETTLSVTLKNGNSGWINTGLYLKEGRVCGKETIFDSTEFEIVEMVERCLPVSDGWLGIALSYDFNSGPITYARKKSPIVYIYRNGIIEFNDVIKRWVDLDSPFFGSLNIDVNFMILRGNCDGMSYDYIIDYVLGNIPFGPIS